MSISKRLFTAVLVLVAVFAIGVSARALELRINHVLSPSEPFHITLVELAEAITARTKGEIKVSVYPLSELGSVTDNVEHIRRGTNIVAVFDPGLAGDYVPEYTAMSGPFLFRNWEELRALDRSEWNQGMRKKLEEKGIKLFSWWDFGFRHVISGKVIKTPADMKGLKIRVPVNKVWIDTFSALGSLPTPLQWSETYSGLSQGVVDAAEAPLGTIYGAKTFEVKKNIALTNHFIAFGGMGMSAKLFNTISPENQEIIQDAFDEFAPICAARTFAADSEMRGKLEKEGVVFSEVDYAAFAEACMKVYDQPNWLPYDQLRSEIEKNMK